MRPAKLDTNQQTVPLPYWWGRKWFAITWCHSKIYNPTTTKVSSGGGKGASKAGGAGQEKHSGDVAGLVACGMADYIEAIRVNNRIVWSGWIDRDESNPEHSGDIVVANVGTFRVHWGTETASGDWLVLDSGGEEHPHYRGQIVLEAKDLQFGTGNTPPNIEVLLERSPRFDGLDEGRSREGANPISGIAEILQNNFYGLGLEDVVDLPTAAAIANHLKDRTKTVAVPGDASHTARMAYCSAYLTERQTALSFISEVLEPIDGWARRNGTKIEFGCYPHDGQVPDGLTELTLHDLAENPQFESGAPDDDDVITDTIVNGPDRDLDMEESGEVGSNPAARERLGQTIQKTFTRPFLITSYQRKEQAQELAHYFSKPGDPVEISVRRSKAKHLMPGDRFILSYDPSASTRVFRIVRRREPATGGVIHFSVTAERAIAPLPYTGDPDPVPDLPSLPGPVAITQGRMFQLPADFTGLVIPVVVPLVVRPSANSSGFAVHFSVNDSSYDFLDSTKSWALRATLAAALNGSATTFTVNASGSDLALLESQTDAAKNDDTLLLFVGAEIMSIGAVSALGSGQYSLTVFRGRRGSTAASHSSGAEAFIIRRYDLLHLTHEDFTRTTSTRYFKLPTFTFAEEQELADALKITFNFADTRPPAPTISAVAGTGRAISISWSKVSLASEYAVYRNATNNAGTATKVAEVTALRFVDLSVNLNTTYYYWVTAIDASELESDKSGVASITTDNIDGDVADAQAAADLAILAATDAQDAADQALAVLADIASDNLLTAGEKPRVIQDYAVITTEQSGIDSKATYYSITTEKSAYDTAVSALTTYLGTLTTPVLWSNLSGNTTIVGATFRSKFSDVYTTRQALLNKIAEVAGTFRNPNAPTNPSAPTYNTGSSYLSGDGTVLSRIVLNLPALPSGAYFLNVLYRKTGASTWIIADQNYTGGGTATIDDLTPGVSYDFAVQAVTYDAAPSSIVAATGSPFIAPNKSSGPANPSGFAGHAPSSTYPVQAKFYSGIQLYGMTVTFTPSADRDLAFYETDITGSSSSAPSAATGTIPRDAIKMEYHSLSLLPQWLWVRAVDRTGNRASWVATVNLASSLAIPAGNMSSQNSNDVAVTGIKTGNGGSVRKKLAEYTINTVIPEGGAVGGSPTEVVVINLSSRGFSTKPDVAMGNPYGEVQPHWTWRYLWGHASSTSNGAAIEIRTTDGSNIGAGQFDRFQFTFIEYD